MIATTFSRLSQARQDVASAVKGLPSPFDRTAQMWAVGGAGYGVIMYLIECFRYDTPVFSGDTLFALGGYMAAFAIGWMAWCWFVRYQFLLHVTRRL